MPVTGPLRSALEPVMLIQHARTVRAFWCVVQWRLGAVRRGDALAMRLWHIRVQGCQQALASLLVQGQTVGTLGEMFLHVMMTLIELFHQIGGAVEVGYHLTLITVKTFLDVI